MTDYRLLLFVHVVAAVVWLGGAAYLQLQARKVIARSNPAELAAFARDAGEIGEKVFMPSAIVLLLAGIYLVIDGDWGFDHFWILSSLMVLVGSAILGGAFLSPEGKRIGELVALRGTEDQEVQDRIKRVIGISRIELIFLFLVVFNMTYKPFL